MQVFRSDHEHFEKCWPPGKPYAHAQYGKLVLVNVLLLVQCSEGPYYVAIASQVSGPFVFSLYDLDETFFFLARYGSFAVLNLVMERVFINFSFRMQTSHVTAYET